MSSPPGTPKRPDICAAGVSPPSVSVVLVTVKLGTSGRPARGSLALIHPMQSQKEHDGVVRAGAADQRAARGRRLDRVGVVVDVAGNERRLAVVADEGAAGPAAGH